MASVKPGGDAPQALARHIDETSFGALAETLADLKDYQQRESDPGRASWLSEIIEDFGATLANLETSLEQAAAM